MPSVMQRIGTPNARHNLDNKYRSHLEHVDPELSKHNEIVRHKPVEEIYAEKLQPAFEEFNQRQKRKDRRLDVKWNCTDALGYQRALDKASQESKNKIDQKGRPPIREIVWQFGNPEQGYGCAGQTDESRAKIKEMLLECQAEAEKRYPQLAFGDVVFHADEVSYDADGKQMGSIHLHADFVPLCYENKQGPGVQVAFERCLKEMGFSTFQAWKHDLDNIMEDVLHRHGLERTVMGNDNEHQDYKEFHRQQKVIQQTNELIQERDKAAAQRDLALQTAEQAKEKAAAAESGVQVAQKELAETETELTAVKQELQEYQDLKVSVEDVAAETKTLPMGWVAVKKEEFDGLEEQARAYRANAPEISKNRETEAALKSREAAAREWEAKNRAKEHDLNSLLRQAQERLESANRYYDRQKDLNRRYRELEAQSESQKVTIAELKEKVSSLESENTSLKTQIAEKVRAATEPLKKQIEGLQELVRGAYQSLKCVVQAVSMLKYDKHQGYRVDNLTAKQERLIDGISEYGEYWAERDGFPEFAKEMHDTAQITKGIKGFMEPEKPKQKEWEIGD